MYDLLLPPGGKGSKGVVEILKEQSGKIKNILASVFSGKVVPKIFTNYQQSTRKLMAMLDKF